MRRRALAAAVLAAVGCDLGDMGELVAQLDVEATLRENSCGSAVGDIPARTRVQVDLFERDGILTWSGSQGTFRATIDEEGNFLYRAEASIKLRDEEPTYDGVRAACVVEQVEEISGKVVRSARPDDDAGETGGDAGTGDPAGVTATDTLRVSTASGADCSDFVGIGTGRFQVLPCRVVLDLEGTER